MLKTIYQQFLDMGEYFCIFHLKYFGILIFYLINVTNCENVCVNCEGIIDPECVIEKSAIIAEAFEHKHFRTRKSNEEQILPECLGDNLMLFEDLDSHACYASTKMGCKVIANSAKIKDEKERQKICKICNNSCKCFKNVCVNCEGIIDPECVIEKSGIIAEAFEHKHFRTRKSNEEQMLPECLGGNLMLFEDLDSHACWMSPELGCKAIANSAKIKNEEERHEICKHCNNQCMCYKNECVNCEDIIDKKCVVDTIAIAGEAWETQNFRLRKDTEEPNFPECLGRGIILAAGLDSHACWMSPKLGCNAVANSTKIKDEEERQKICKDCNTRCKCDKSAAQTIVPKGCILAIVMVVEVINVLHFVNSV